MSVGVWQTPEEPAPTPVDTLVIGAGLIGSFLALRLSEAGRSVTVVDARHAAGGASGRNGGLLLTGIAHSYAAACQQFGRDRTRELWHITLKNRELMVRLAQHFGTPVRRCGSLILAASHAEATELEESVAMMTEDGFAAEWHAIDPLGRGFLGAIRNNDDGAIQPALLVEAMLKASGAAFHQVSEVYRVESTDAGVLVRFRGGAFLAHHVFMATNAWTPHVLPEFAPLITPARGQVLVTAPGAPVLPYAAYCDYGFVYFQQLPDGRFVLGGYRNRAFEEERTYADAVTPLIQTELESFLSRHFPELASVPIERRWSGTMAFTPDGLPLVGRLKRDPRIAFAVGFNGHGLGLGVMAAEELLGTLSGGSPGLFSAVGRTEIAG